MRTTSIALALCALAGCAAQPETSAPAHQVKLANGQTYATNKEFVATSAKGGDPSEQMTCRLEATVGSHLNHYVCLSKNEEQEAHEAAQHTMHDFQRPPPKTQH